MMDDIDISEQCEGVHAFSTPETRAKAKKDPIQAWAEAKKLNSVHEDIIIAIRKGKRVTSGWMDVKGMGFGSRGGSANRDEPKEGREYRVWSAKVMGRFGTSGLDMILGCIIEGEDCPFDLLILGLQEW